ncbi:MAG: phenylalanine--tRNA ligase subunit beta [Saprospiraceae bacterium]|nr:phenylalanine--tRNA ligase subunit beta [Saprospiraceae bacterium]
MKISLNWLRDFLDIHKTPSEIADILTSLGLEVEGFETVKPSPVDLDKVLTATVLTCERIPDTDHLSATTVDAGDGVVRSVVCGAPNVAAGQKVWLAVPGANVFSKDGSLFTIGERKVRGIASQGMICAEDELGLGHDHAGIIVLPADTSLGISAANYYNLASDVVIEIGLTPNRADATCHIGVAEDILAWLRVHEDENTQLRDLDFLQAGLENLPEGLPQFPVEVENHEACPMYTGVVIEGIKIGESPEWMKNRLLAVGQRPINNVVDITNYVRIELGQPLHAFDLDKVKGGKIVVKTMPAGTQFVTLDGIERKLFAEDLMICDGQSTPMCIGGVFGGAESGVSETTTRIFLEAAIFNPKWIRRTMIRHNLRTDSAWVFEKGADMDNTLDGLIRATLLIQQLAGGRITSEFTSICPVAPSPAVIPATYARINQLIGENLGPERIHRILKALNIPVANQTAEGFDAYIPTNKPDVTREADLIEEILRVHGLDNVPIPTQIRSSMEVTQSPTPESVRNLVSEMLVANGFNECMSLSLGNSAHFSGENAIFPMEGLVYIHNSANQGLDCMRPTMVLSALDTLLHNQNRQNADVRLFEFGKVYSRRSEDGKLLENARLTLTMSGVHDAESWQPSAKKAVDFYSIKAYVQNLLTRLGVLGYQETVLQEKPFQYALKYHRGPQELVVFGALEPGVLKRMDIKNAVFYADFNFENLLKAMGANKIQFQELNKFPTVRRDMALVLDKTVSFGEIRQLATKTAKKMLKEVNLFDVFEDEAKLGNGKKSYAVSFVFEDPEKTLQDKEIDALMSQLTDVFEGKLGANIRK